MRTTLNIDDEVFYRAKALAVHQKRTLGEVLTEAMRERLDRPSFIGVRRNGVLTLPDRPGPMVTTEMVIELRDDEEF